ncbi:hypothetical protein [Actinomadura formosensis]|uniref:hypothetical protein n=1 Tax=Actinomadura formosensis TaxID=60706 RepID=UPI003D8BAF05
MRDRGVTVECCPTSNVHTGGVATVDDHPVLRMARCGISATVNTGNRLTSRTSLSQETELLATTFAAGPDEIRDFHVRAAEAAFLPPAERRRLVARIVQFDGGAVPHR